MDIIIFFIENFLTSYLKFIRPGPRKEGISIILLANQQNGLFLENDCHVIVSKKDTHTANSWKFT